MRSGRALATAGGVVAAGGAPLIASVQPVRRALTPRILPARLSGISSTHHVALTFDDGPDPASTPAFLDLLAAYDVTRVTTSTSTRCVQTVRPYAETAGLELDLRPRLSEERATPRAVAKIVEELLATDGGSVLCTHRPVLPLVYDAAGLDVRADDAGLEPAEMLVLHVRKGAVVAVERHRPRATAP